MHRIDCVKYGIAAAVVAAAFVAGTAFGQPSPPAQSKGVTIATPAVLDLGTIVDSIPGR